MRFILMLIILSLDLFSVTIKTIPSKNLEGMVTAEPIDIPIEIWEADGRLFYQSETNYKLYEYIDNNWKETGWVGLNGNQVDVPKKIFVFGDKLLIYSRNNGLLLENDSSKFNRIELKYEEFTQEQLGEFGYDRFTQDIVVDKDDNLISLSIVSRDSIDEVTSDIIDRTTPEIVYFDSNFESFRYYRSHFEEFPQLNTKEDIPINTYLYRLAINQEGEVLIGGDYVGVEKIPNKSNLILFDGIDNWEYLDTGYPFAGDDEQFKVNLISTFGNKFFVQHRKKVTHNQFRISPDGNLSSVGRVGTDIVYPSEFSNQLIITSTTETEDSFLAASRENGIVQIFEDELVRIPIQIEGYPPHFRVGDIACANGDCFANIWPSGDTPPGLYKIEIDGINTSV